MKKSAQHEFTCKVQLPAHEGLWYQFLAMAEEVEAVNNLFLVYKHYGDGSDPNFSPIIALGESWAYHIGHYLDELNELQFI